MQVVGRGVPKLRVRAKSADVASTTGSSTSTVVSTKSGADKICHGCSVGAYKGHEIDKVYKCLHFNSSCWTATVKNRHKIIRTNAISPAAKDQLISDEVTKMVKTPDLWRKDVAGSLPGALPEEKKQASASLKNEAASFEQVNSIESQLHVSGDIILKRRHFAKVWKKWENSDSETYLEEANENFNKLKLEQDRPDDSDGDSNVRFRNPKKKVQNITGPYTRLPYVNLNQRRFSCFLS